MEPVLTMVIRSCAAASGLGLAAWLVWVIVHASLAPSILLPAAAALVGLTLIRPTWGVYATIAIAPLLGRFTEVFGTAYFVPAEVLFYAAFSGWLLHMGLHGGDWKPTAVHPWVLIWGVVIACSVLVEMKAEPVRQMPGGWLQRVPDLFTGYPKEAPLYPLRAAFTYFAGIAAFVLIGQSVRHDRERERLIQVLTAVSVLVCGYAGYQFVTGSDLHLGVSVQSTLTDKAALGGYFALMMGLVLGQTRSLGWSRIAGFVLLPVCVAGLYFSRSGNAWLAVAVLLLIVVAVQMRSFWTQRRGTVAIQSGLLLVVVAGLAVGVAQNMDTRIERGRLKRPLYWMASMDALRDHPVWGIGVGRIFTTPYTNRRGLSGAHAHNDVLQVATELGLVGVGAWLALLMVWGRETRRQLGDSPDAASAWTQVALLLGAAGFLLAGLGENLLGYVEQQVLLGSVLGAAPRPSGRGASVKVWWLAAGWGLVVVLSVLLRQPLP